MRGCGGVAAVSQHSMSRDLPSVLRRIMTGRTRADCHDALSALVTSSLTMSSAVSASVARFHAASVAVVWCLALLTDSGIVPSATVDLCGHPVATGMFGSFIGSGVSDSPMLRTCKAVAVACRNRRTACVAAASVFPLRETRCDGASPRHRTRRTSRINARASHSAGCLANRHDVALPVLALNRCSRALSLKGIGLEFGGAVSCRLAVSSSRLRVVVRLCPGAVTVTLWVCCPVTTADRAMPRYCLAKLNASA